MSGTPDNYRFKHFDIRVMMSDLRFSRAARQRRGLDINRTVSLSDGSSTTLKTLAADKPLVLITGSLSCPMTISSLPLLRELLSNYQSAFSIALVYVREAHPGEHYAQPDTIGQKLANACLFNELYDLQMPIIVDDLPGSLHHALDTKPNSLHIIGTNGDILFQSLWAGDMTAAGRAFEAIVSGKPPASAVSEKMLAPFLRGAGYIHDTLKLAGRQANRELMLGAPPVWLLSRTAATLKPVSRERRGWLALILILLVLAVPVAMLL